MTIKCQSCGTDLELKATRGYWIALDRVCFPVLLCAKCKAKMQEEEQ